MKAKIEIEIDEKIYRAIAPDIGKNDKIEYKNGILIYEVSSNNFTHIKAAINSLLELIDNLLKINKINYGSNDKKNNRPF
jgi:tRNA threonylcarbamoyladenosine modification (KEOPS) complex  Pcc1 subunit